MSSDLMKEDLIKGLLDIFSGDIDRGKPGQPGMPRDAEDRARQPHDVCGRGRFGQCGREVDG